MPRLRVVIVRLMAFFASSGSVRMALRACEDNYSPENPTALYLREYGLKL